MNGFLAVSHMQDVVGESSFSQRAQGQLGIVRVVFDQKNFDRVWDWHFN
jgi:hypothetical protein